MGLDLIAYKASKKYVDETLTGAGALKGEKGDPGVDGKSPYDIAVDNGFIGTETEWLESLKARDGKDGVTPNLTIGTVETLEAGSDATATITGDKENPVLNLGIPKGANGEIYQPINLLEGINWCAIGDSFTWGDPANEKFTDRNGKEWCLTATTWLANEIGANLIQVGFGGAHFMPRIVDGEIDTSVANYITNPNWWYGMKNITSNTQLITIQVGLNDNAGVNYPIGTYGDETLLTSYGAFKVLMDKIKETCPFAKIGLIVSDAFLRTEYANFLYDLSKKYNLPILDLSSSTVGTIYGTSAGDSYNYNFASAEVKTANNEKYRISSTNGHPNTESHKLRAEKLKLFIKYLMNVNDRMENVQIDDNTSEISQTGMVGIYSTSQWKGDTFKVIPTSSAFVTSRNFLKFVEAGTSSNMTPLVEGETITVNGVDITLNADGSVTLNGTASATFYINSNISSDFRTAIIGQTAKVSYSKSDDTVSIPFNTGMAFNDATYGYNLTKTGSNTGVVTADKLTSMSRLTVSSEKVFDNVTVAAMLELQSDAGYLTDYTKSDCDAISASTEYAIADYSVVSIVGEHTITYKVDGSVRYAREEEVTEIKQTNPLYGKKVTCIGDSLCYGQGFSGGYCTVLGELEKDTTFINKAVGGAQIASNHGSGESWWIENQLSNVADDTDYIICEGYVNDYLTGCSLGEISSGYDAALDTTTFYGGMESLCKKLANDYTEKRSGFIITHSHYSTNATYDNSLYITAIKDCCEKWGIPYLDLSCIITPLITNCKNTFYSDGLHYNEAGYRRITPAIREWIKTL